MTAPLTNLTDAALVARLRQTCFESNRLLAELIRLLIEVDDRRVHLSKAYPSLFEFCLKELRMSEGEAYRRINATKLVRRFPQLLAHIERGDIHLTALVQLRDHFTEDNVDDVVAEAKGKNKMQLAELVARLAPRPDVPANLRKLPHHDTRSRMTKPPKPSLEPLSEERYRLEVTRGRAFRDKLLRVRDLMMHTNPSGDLGVVIERAVDELLDVLEKRIFGKLSRKSTDGSLHPASGNAPSKIAPSSPADCSSKTRRRLDPLREKKKDEEGADGGRPGLARTSRKARQRSGHESPRGGSPSRGREPIRLRQRKSVLGSSVMHQ